jgi:peptidoglycan/LPS O-acetylase OafA/YrhL
MRTLRQVDTGRQNNFNLIRVLAAVCVIFTHSYTLCAGRVNQDPFWKLTGYTPSELAVDAFFVISGYLVLKSLFSRGSVGAFVLARGLRIFPGLFVCSLFSAFVAGSALTALPTRDYLRNGAVYRYVFEHTQLFDFLNIPDGLPGVFQKNPIPNMVNASLWTLPAEVWLYAAVAVLALIGVMERRRWFDFLAGGVVVIYVSSQVVGFVTSEAIANMLRFSGCFFMGALCCMHGDRIPVSWTLLGAGALLAGLAWPLGLIRAVVPLWLAYSLFVLALLPKGRLLAYNRLGDYSYGVYIYAYPVQQSLLALFPGFHPLCHFLASTLCTLPLAVLSWYLIERPALSLKDKSVRPIATQGYGG